MADFELTGVRELVATLNAKPRHVLEACGEGLYRMGEHVMALAKSDYVPVDTGTLKRSGKVRPARYSANEAHVGLEFGGAAAPYAVYVHERTDVHHPHGQAKYLENAVKWRANQGAVNTWLVPRIREALLRRVG